MPSHHIVMLIQNMSFPKDRRVRQEAFALQEAGFRVSVICPRGSTQDTAGYEDVQGVPVFRYPQPWLATNKASYFLEYGWAMVCTLLYVAAIWLRDGFDVLHAANPPDLFFLVAAPFKLLGKKFVFDQHDLSPEMFETKFGKRGLVYRLLLFLERWSYHLADLVIVTNQSFQEIAEQRGGVTRDRLRIVRNGPDLRTFRPVPPRPELKNGAAHLAVYVGVMGKQDGVERVIEAADHIVNHRGRKDVHFSLLGSGDCFETLNAMVRDLRLQSSVTLPGWMADGELLAHLSTADVCLAPDPPVRMNQLSTMIKIMEYMSCAKPIVSFDLLESRRSAGPSAIFVQRDDPFAFGDAILELLDDAARRAQMGQAGWERVKTELHWGRSQEALLSGYDHLFPDAPAWGAGVPRATVASKAQ